MCGIAGFVRLDGRPADPEALRAMGGAVRHRGPDRDGLWHEGPVGLAHRRLKIVDLSEASSQPMLSEDGRYVVVFNGEIYDFRKRRAELEAQGHLFRSTGDTEVLLKLYQIHGEKCLDHLRGMFAFAIVDRREKTLFLARDRVGKKPIKYFRAGGVFAFASEEKALRALPECPTAVDREALHHLLTLTYIPAPRTGVEGIRKLPAGRCLTLRMDTGEATERRYWALRYRPDRKASVAEWKERILSTLTESVRLRMIADVPVGAFLSGGVDSATVVALMSRLHPEPVKTFSIGSRHGTSELDDAERIATAFGTDHHPVTLEPDIVRLLPELVAAYEEPLGDPSTIPTYLVAKHAREHVTVALSGDGGDECFGGYLRYPILAFSERWRRMPAPLLAGFRGGAALYHRLRNDTLSYRADLFHRTLPLPWPRRVLNYMGGFTADEKAMAEAAPTRALRDTGEWFEEFTADARSRADDLVHRAMNADLETYLPDDLMPKVDLGAMAHALEVRSPLLDHELLELTATMPSEYHVNGWKTKWLFKEALAGLLPEETLRKKKRGFRLPLDAWFRGELRSYARERILGAPAEFWTFFDRDGTEKFLDGYFASRVDKSPQAWMLLWLSEWFTQRA